jgi:hypothetical protein
MYQMKTDSTPLDLTKADILLYRLVHNKDFIYCKREKYQDHNYFFIISFFLILLE